MPRTFNGIGTTYYGRRNVDKNGSYITTEFYVVFYFPIFPHGSYRILHRGVGSSKWFLVLWSNSEEFFVKKLPLNIGQVINVYLTAFSILIGIPILIFFLDGIFK